MLRAPHHYPQVSRFSRVYTCGSSRSKHAAMLHWSYVNAFQRLRVQSLFVATPIQFSPNVYIETYFQTFAHALQAAEPYLHDFSKSTLMLRTTNRQRIEGLPQTEAKRRHSIFTFRKEKSFFEAPSNRKT
jgi:hypothetical protein